MMVDESAHQPPDRRSDAERRDARAGLTAKRRVLVADDNRDWADTLTAFLEDEGYSVRTTYDGFQALDAANAFEPQIVLLDIRMPRLGGHAAARFFNARRERPVLIAMTGCADDDGKQYAQGSGFDHYLVKPTDLAAILALLKSV
jgi:DNA-binding response OmpR family regulator